MAALEVKLDGAKQLYALGAKMRDAPKKVQNATRRELRKVVQPLLDDIRDEAETMPKGYEQVLARSLEHRIDINTGYFASVTLTTSAKGQQRLRKLGAIDKGVLRHPVHGRYRKTKRGRKPNPWVAQPVKPGVWTRPVRAGAPRIRRELTRVIASELRKATQGVS